MKITVLTLEKQEPGEIEQIITLFESGLETLHLKKRNLTSKEMERFISEIPAIYYDKIVLHGHYKLAVKFKLKGIHLSKSHRGNSIADKWRRLKLKIQHRKLIFTTSFHSLQSLQQNKSSFEYVFLSPVFTSKTYYDPTEASGLNVLRKAINLSNQKVLALGGVNEEKLPIVKAAGFYGIGLSSSIWKSVQTPSKSLVRFLAA
jgi:thiamine-phosphate pyrophosphorylase